MSTDVALERDSSNGATGAALRRRVRLVVAQNRVPADQVVARDEGDLQRRGNDAPAYARAGGATPAQTSASAGGDVEDEPPELVPGGEPWTQPDVRSLARALDARLYDVLMKGDLPFDAADPELSAAANPSEMQLAEVQAPVRQPESQEYEARVESPDPAEGDVGVLTEEDLRPSSANASSGEAPPAEPAPPAAPSVRMPQVGVIRRLGPHVEVESDRVGAERKRRARGAGAARARSRPTPDFAVPRPTPRRRMRRTDVMNGLRQLGIGLLIAAVSVGVAVLLT